MHPIYVICVGSVTAYLVIMIGNFISRYLKLKKDYKRQSEAYDRYIKCYPYTQSYVDINTKRIEDKYSKLHQAQLEDGIAYRKQLDEQVDSLRKELYEKDQALITSNSLIKTQNMAIDKLKTDYDKLEDKLKAAEFSLSKITEEKLELERKLKSVEMDCIDAGNTIRSLEEDKKELEGNVKYVAAMEKQLHDVLTSLELTRRELDTTKEDLSRAKDSKQEVTIRLTRLITERDNLQNKLNTLVSRLKAITEDRVRVFEEFSHPVILTSSRPKYTIGDYTTYKEEEKK